MAAPPKENTFWLAFGIGAVLLAGAVVAITVLSPPVGAALISAYILGGFGGSMAGGWGIGKLAEKAHDFAHDMHLSRQDAKVADANKLVAQPSKIAEKDKIVYMSEKNDKIYRAAFIVGAVAAAAAIITVAVLCPPAGIAAIVLIGLGCAFLPGAMGWLSAEVAVRCFGERQAPARRPGASGVADSLLTNVGGPRGYGATATSDGSFSRMLRGLSVASENATFGVRTPGRPAAQPVAGAASPSPRADAERGHPAAGTGLLNGAATARTPARSAAQSVAGAASPSPRAAQAFGARLANGAAAGVQTPYVPSSGARRSLGAFSRISGAGSVLNGTVNSQGNQRESTGSDASDGPNAFRDEEYHI
jgi:hypothetical protein